VAREHVAPDEVDRALLGDEAGGADRLALGAREEEVEAPGRERARVIAFPRDRIGDRELPARREARVVVVERVDRDGLGRRRRVRDGE
jgi:hypothetical protein